MQLSKAKAAAGGTSARQTKTQSPAAARQATLAAKPCCGFSPQAAAHTASSSLPWRFGNASVLPAPIQRKLAIGRADDPMEHEADRVADRVMRMQHPDHAQVTRDGHGQCEACAEGVVRRQPGATPISARMGLAPPLQRKPPVVQEILSSPGRPLDDATRSFFEPRFQRDFSKVRIHTDNKASESAKSVRARAYAFNNDLVFGTAQYVPTLRRDVD
jgi:hypothetical protein